MTLGVWEFNWILIMPIIGHFNNIHTNPLNLIYKFSLICECIPSGHGRTPHTCMHSTPPIQFAFILEYVNYSRKIHHFLANSTAVCTTSKSVNVCTCQFWCVAYWLFGHKISLWASRHSFPLLFLFWIFVSRKFELQHM